MSTVEAPKPVEVPATGTLESAPAPVEPVTIDIPVVGEAPKSEEVKPEGEVVAPVEEKKEEKTEAKPVEPIESGALGYKAPGLKNAFRFSKKYFWFGEAPIASANLREYLRGEKPEVAHPTAAWSSQTGKGLLFFVKHADQKENPAGVLNLAYATDLHKDGTQAFAFKLSGHKHAFEAQNAPERDGWFVAFEKAIAEAKASKDGIESSEAYKEEKEKIGKPTTLAAAAVAAPKKSTDATPKPAETEAAPVVAAPAGEEAVVAAPARTGSASSSSSDEEKKAKKSKSKSRSASRKRASIFGGLLGKKDKAEEKKEEKKEEHKIEGESSKAQPDIKDETPVVAPIAETSTAPVITSDIPEVSSELKTEAPPAAIVPAAVEEPKTEESTVKPVEEKPKPTKRGSIFGSFFEKVKSPTHEKKEADLVPAPIAKDAETTPEASKPLEEAEVAVPATIEPVSEPTVVKADETKPAVSTPTKERDHFKFGRLFSGSKDRAKSPAATDKTPVSEPSKVDAVAPQLEDTTVPVVSEPIEPVVAAPVAETKAEPTPVENKEETSVKKDETSKKEKRGSIFAQLGRSLSKATKKDSSKEAKKETATPTTVPEASEPKEETSAVAPIVAEEKKEETAPVAAPVEQTIGDVAPASINVGEAPKSAPAVSTSA